MSVAAGVMAAASAANAIGNISETILNQYNAYKTRQFNREEAAKNRTFQKEMAQNNIKYAVNQANELGISPSLVLGDQTKQLGGSSASVGNPSPSNMGNIGNTLTGLANVLQEQIKLNKTQEMNEDRLHAMQEMNENKLQTMKEMNENKLQTMKEIQMLRMNNSTTNTNNEYYKRNIEAIENTKKNLNNFNNF